MPNTKDQSAPNKGARVEGEGSYSATRGYNKNLGRSLADKKSIDRGRAAARAAVEGPEAPELRAAEKRAKSGPRAAAKRVR